MQPADMEFMYKLYASTRADVHQIHDWNEDQKDQFLRMQFNAQHSHYQKHFPTAEFNLILNKKRKPIGRLYLHHREDEFRILDISLLPQHRRKGIGSTIIKDIMEQGRVAALPVRLHVARYNPALSWYTRMGFERIEETEMSFLMEWSVKKSIYVNSPEVIS